jgi:hypothetical protein
VIRYEWWKDCQVILTSRTYPCSYVWHRYSIKVNQVNFPFLCRNIPAAPAYGVYISQLILYCRACGTSWNILERGLLLTRKILGMFLHKNGKFTMRKLKSFICRNTSFLPSPFQGMKQMYLYLWHLLFQPQWDRHFTFATMTWLTFMEYLCHWGSCVWSCVL